MCDGLGDPHVFATHSFADTHCPYVAEFILAWRGIARDAQDSAATQLGELNILGPRPLPLGMAKWPWNAFSRGGRALQAGPTRALAGSGAQLTRTGVQ